MAAEIQNPEQIIDAGAVAGALRTARQAFVDEDVRVRARAVQIFRRALLDGQAVARRRLESGDRGSLCAKTLCFLQDEIIRILYDFTVNHICGVDSSAGTELAVIAVGGYGRGTLAPGSDVDLIFLYRYELDKAHEEIIAAMLYVLWDMGLKVGHSVRSIDDSILQAHENMMIRTTLLEARFLAGEENLFTVLMKRFDEEVVTGNVTAFVAAKLNERDLRHKKSGESRYLVEPNVKDGKGGLRDLHTLFWIAKYIYRVNHLSDLADQGVFMEEEVRRFQRCEDFLWAVRCSLHFLAGRAQERLSFDFQRDMARSLGYTDHPGLKNVERFMKHYFLIAKDVGDLTRIFCSVLETRHEKDVPVDGELLIKFDRLGAVRKDFMIDAGRLGGIRENVFQEDPVNLIRIFYLADLLGILIHPDTLKLITRSLRLIDDDLRGNSQANDLFLKLLTSSHDPEVYLRKMNEAGVLGRFIPDFGRIVALMQFNMYHHYTADEHLLRAVGFLSEIEKGSFSEEHPLADKIIHTIQSRSVLYVAMFLHDIAKGRDEDHCEAGARIVRALGPRFGLSPAEIETTAWLVDHHLLMSDIAQKRDLNDPKTIRNFADKVQSLERLKLLLVLTVADIKAVGPGVWNGWKGQLLRTLYYETEALLAGGHSTISRDQRINNARAALAGRFGDWPEVKVRNYLERLSGAYLVATEPERVWRQAQMVDRTEEKGLGHCVEATTIAFHEVTEILLYTRSHPALLAQVTGACTQAGGSIMDAEIHATRDGWALWTLYLQNPYARMMDTERFENRMVRSIEQAVVAPDRALPVLDPDAMTLRGRIQAFAVEPQVLIDNSWSDDFSVIEVNGLDRPGLLYELTRVLYELELSIGSAHIATFGERVVDVFYVIDLAHHKIDDEGRREKIETALMAVLS